MIGPTPQDITAAKQAAAMKFGHDRLVGVTYNDPMTLEPLVEVLIARLRWIDAVAYYDQRTVSIIQARSTMFADRLVFPDAAALAPMREQWAAFDRCVEDEFRGAMGFTPPRALARARPLTATTAPPGLSAKAVTDLLAENTGCRIWAVHLSDNGLACVLRSPTPDVWQMTQTMAAEAQANGTGQLCPALDIISDHCVWSPAPTLRAHIEELPGRAADLASPWVELGGAAAKTSSRFL